MAWVGAHLICGRPVPAGCKEAACALDGLDGIGVEAYREHVQYRGTDAILSQIAIFNVSIVIDVSLQKPK